MINETKRKIRNDFILILLVVIIVSAAGAIYYLFREEGSFVSVSVDGELYGVFALTDERTEHLLSSRGTNTLIIKDGKASIESASCPDGICAAHRPISREGESIVCLPNKVVVTVNGSENSPEVDIIA